MALSEFFASVRDRRNRREYYKRLNIDEFGVEQQEGSFDLSDAQTAFLSDQGLSEDQMDSIETQFIDELYGTSEGQTIIDGQNVEHSQSEWQTTYYDDGGAIAQGDSSALWGLDLRRTMVDEDGETITASHPEYYEHLTRGEVNWESYLDDPKYIEVFNNIGAELDDGDEVKLSDLTSDQYTDEQRAEFIRKANVEIDDPWTKDRGNRPKDQGKHLDWDKYDKDKIFRDKGNNLFIDGERQETLKDLWANDEGRLTVNAPGEHTAILQRRQVPRPVIPGVSWDGDTPSLTHRNTVKLPRNIRGLFKGGSGE